MDLEKFLELVFNNPDNIEIQYSNVNGKEKFIVNGQDLIKESFDDSQVKKDIEEFKTKIENLDDYIFEKVVDKIEEKQLDIHKLNNSLELEHYTEEQASYAYHVINLMTEFIQDVIKQEIQNLMNTLETF